MTKYIIGILLILISIAGFSQRHLIGQKAPELKVDKWIYPKIKVEDWNVDKVPEKLYEKPIFLDLWFTKCAPCVASIPHLNKLAKLYPEITFLSISYENEATINNFLDKMIMYYPVGVDTTMQTIDKFDACGYPTSFLIDEEGIIQWAGSPFIVSEDMMNKFLGKSVSQKKNIHLAASESPIYNSAFDFTIKEHTLEMNEASYTHTYPFDINIFNKSLESLLVSYYKINKTRIISADSIFLHKKYDITLKADKSITTDQNCVPMLKFLLAENLRFSIEQLDIDTIAFEIKIVNDSLLRIHKSTHLGFGTWNRVEYMDLKGATLNQLRDFVENHFNIITSIKTNNSERFDFFIPLSSFIEAKKTLLSDYGIEIEGKKQKVEFWKIEQKQ